MSHKKKRVFPCRHEQARCGMPRSACPAAAVPESGRKRPHRPCFDKPEWSCASWARDTRSGSTTGP